MENRRLERDIDSAKDTFDALIAEIEELERQVELKDLKIGELEDKLEDNDNYIEELKEKSSQN